MSEEGPIPVYTPNDGLKLIRYKIKQVVPDDQADAHVVDETTSTMVVPFTIEGVDHFIKTLRKLRREMVKAQKKAEKEAHGGEAQDTVQDH